MKRKLTILLTTLTTLAVLTACGNGGDTATDTEAPAPTEETVAEDPAPTEDLADVVEDLTNVTEEEVAAGPQLCDTFVQLITDENLNGMTGEFLVDYLVNYESDPAGYDAKMAEIFGADFEEEDAFAVNNPELVERGIARISIRIASNGTYFGTPNVDYDNHEPSPRANVIINKADWDAMEANLVKGETTYEEIVAELGAPGEFINASYYPNSNNIGISVCWYTYNEETGIYKDESLEFDGNGVL